GCKESELAASVDGGCQQPEARDAGSLRGPFVNSVPTRNRSDRQWSYSHKAPNRGRSSDSRPGEAAPCASRADMRRSTHHDAPPFPRKLSDRMRAREPRERSAWRAQEQSYSWQVPPLMVGCFDQAHNWPNNKPQLGFDEHSFQ